MSALKWIVANKNRKSLDIHLDARVVISAARQESESLAPAERTNVVVTSYFEPDAGDATLMRGLTLLNDTLYACALPDREESWNLVGAVEPELKRLHRLAKRRHGSYEAAMADWEAYRLFAAELAAQLPMPWHPLGCDNPSQNVSGSTNGANHIVLDVAWTSGRFIRAKDDALCQPWQKFNGNVFVAAKSPTCKQCLFRNEQIVRERLRHLLEGSFDQKEHATFQT